MSFARIKSSGRGKLNARLVIEGFPYQFVTDAAMAVSANDSADGRARIDGMLLDGISFGATADFLGGKITGRGFSPKFVDTDTFGQRVALTTKAFASKPSLFTLLTSNASTSDTTIDAANTDPFPSSGHLHLNTETVSYSGKTSTAFTGVTRARWDTVAQAHYMTRGEAEFFTRITNYPTTIEGRTCFLHLYGEGDDLQGAGTQVFVGVVSTDPRWTGKEWTFTIDPVTSFLKQDIGSPPVARFNIRGIYYPDAVPFQFLLVHWDGSRYVRRPVRLSGYYDSELGFCLALTAAVNAAIVTGLGFGSFNSNGRKFTFTPTPDGFLATYYTGTAGSAPSLFIEPPFPPTAFEVFKPNWEMDHDGPFSWYSYNSDGSSLRQAPFAESTTFPVDTTRRKKFYAPFPRAYVTYNEYEPPFWPNPSNRIFYGNPVPVDPGFSIRMKTKNAEDDEVNLYYVIDSVDDSSRYIDVTGSTPTLVASLDGFSDIKVGTQAVQGGVLELLALMSSNAPDRVNLGLSPLFRINRHFENNSQIIYNTLPRVYNRQYSSFVEPISLEKVVSADMIAYGYIWYLTSAGRLGYRRLALESNAFTPTATITADDLGGGFPSWEKTAYGQVSEVVYKTGFDYEENKWTGPTIRVRNTASAGLNRRGQTVTIERRNQYVVTPDIAPEVVTRIAQRWMALMGGAYEIVTITVSLAKFDLLIGDTVAITTTLIPDKNGTFGIDDRLGLVIGHERNIANGTISLTLLLTSREIAGFAPSYLLTGQSNTAGNTWVLTLDLSDMGTETPDKHFVAGDPIRLIPWFRGDSAVGSTTRIGTVVSTTASTVTVTLTASWTPSTFSWVIRPRDASTVTIGTNLSDCYVFLANQKGFIQFSGGDQDAAETGP